MICNVCAQEKLDAAYRHGPKRIHTLPRPRSAQRETHVRLGLIDQIEKHNGGFWKPSPGSIYPLLSWLQEKGYIKELPTENSFKRYELTSTGKSLLEEQKMVRKKYREEAGFPPSPFFDNLLMKIPPEETAKIRESMKRLAIAFFQLGAALQENFSGEALKEALAAVDETARKLEQVNKKLKETKERETKYVNPSR